MNSSTDKPSNQESCPAPPSEGEAHGDWTWFDNVWLDLVPQVGVLAFAVYCVLARHCNWKRPKASGKRKCFPEINTIATTLGVTARSVRNAIKSLQSNGWVSVEKRYKPGKGSLPNLYTVHSPLDPGEIKDSPGVKKTTGGEGNKRQPGGEKNDSPGVNGAATRTRIN